MHRVLRLLECGRPRGSDPNWGALGRSRLDLNNRTIVGPIHTDSGDVLAVNAGIVPDLLWGFADVQEVNGQG